MGKIKKQFLSSREDFERNFCILEELLRNGLMSFTESSRKSAESLQKIRKLPNGRIDFHTVNEMARLSANSVSNFDNMKYEDQNEKK
ncbi:AVAST type 1 anti-phage system protein Avs1c [Flavobacterium sp. KACC 22763]|uniref:AVAST type 1 anti-phage system protein Avs1c n=1 Tax=Flavobacterium sp. KACC 22763 TaxID=3025668 RepID=UPI0023667656|nr:AVAST type 1 anti-phage system protein Avs1c [Flavobacterium sp. KACC 22763]WDF66123.1 hypothetical protein PQ463_08140 [Flavobacterium sp. KACC 22763]